MFASCQRTSGLLVTFWVMEYPKCDKQLWCIWSWKFDFKGWSLWSGMQLMMLPWYTQSATLGRSTINIAAGLQIYWNSFFIQPSCLGFDMKGNCLPKAIFCVCFGKVSLIILHIAVFYNCWLKVKHDSIMQKNNKDQMSTKHGMNVTLGYLAAIYFMADRVSDQQFKVSGEGHLIQNMGIASRS